MSCEHPSLTVGSVVTSPAAEAAGSFEYATLAKVDSARSSRRLLLRLSFILNPTRSLALLLALALSVDVLLGDIM